MSTRKYLDSIKKSKKIMSQVRCFVEQQKVLNRAARQVDHKIDKLLEENMQLEAWRDEFNNH